MQANQGAYGLLQSSSFGCVPFQAVNFRRWMDTSSLHWEEKLNAGGVLVDCQKYHAEIRGTAKYRLVVIGHQVGRSTWRYLDARTGVLGRVPLADWPRLGLCETIRRKTAVGAA
jgi:hypothetical protein